MNIKFRGWHFVYKKLLPVECINFREDYISLNDGDNSLSDTMDMIDLTQYTGWKDKNEKEIYQLDIVKMKFYDGEDNIIAEEINVVMLEEDTLMMTFAPSTRHRGLTYRDYFSRYKNCNSISYEIIGNIFEDKNLLEVKSDEGSLHCESK